jgi:hypothetical protein
MSTQTLNPPPARSLDQLAQLCLDHAAAEESHLDETLAALQVLRQALLGRDHLVLAGALKNQEGLARAADALQGRRACLQQEAAKVFGLPSSSVTRSVLASRLPPETALQLEQIRQRLGHKAAEVERLNRSNGVLLHYFLGFLQRFFQGLTGCSPDGRYSPTGSQRYLPCGFLINARG